MIHSLVTSPILCWQENSPGLPHEVWASRNLVDFLYTNRRRDVSVKSPPYGQITGTKAIIMGKMALSVACAHPGSCQKARFCHVRRSSSNSAPDRVILAEILAARKLEIGSGISSFRAMGQLRQKRDALSVPRLSNGRLSTAWIIHRDASGLAARDFPRRGQINDAALRSRRRDVAR